MGNTPAGTRLGGGDGGGSARTTVQIAVRNHLGRPLRLVAESFSGSRGTDVAEIPDELKAAISIDIGPDSVDFMRKSPNRLMLDPGAVPTTVKNTLRSEISMARIGARQIVRGGFVLQSWTVGTRPTWV